MGKKHDRTFTSQPFNYFYHKQHNSTLSNGVDIKMALEKDLGGDIVIDMDIAMMTSKRCNQGETTTPNLLELPDTKEAYNIVERYIFWNVIWKPLHKLGWILDKDGNYECEFIVIPPLEPICNTMKKNMDFFENEVELVLALFADPRLALQKDLGQLREQYDTYLLQFTILQAQLSNNQMIKTVAVSTNEGILKLLESRVAVSQQVRQYREEKESSLLIQSVIAGKKKEQALAMKSQLLMDEPEKHQVRRKRLHREIIIIEYERRTQINGGKFPIATACHPSEKASIPAVISLQQLVQQRHQQQQQLSKNDNGGQN